MLSLAVFNQSPLNAFVFNDGSSGSAATGALTLADLRRRLCERLDEVAGSPVFYASAEMNSALNKAQNLWALLTLCIERTASFTLTAATAFHTITTTISDYKLPLRVTLNGSRLQPNTLQQLDSLSETWFATAGTPTKYFAKGLDVLAVYPQSASQQTVSLTYAAQPALMVDDTDEPEIEALYHDALLDFAVYILRAKEGGAEFQNSLMYLDRFLTEAARRAEYIRSRSRAQNFDVLPFDLARFDKSRLVKMVLPNQRRAQK
jgi:hypothetical protein